AALTVTSVRHDAVAVVIVEADIVALGTSLVAIAYYSKLIRRRGWPEADMAFLVVVFVHAPRLT
ncbi:hypothetical protein EUX98_g9762, partial [Antrodiella citrinella]